ncbi:MAG: HAD-IIIA family hydrolase [Bacteroidales bacterium]|nr:HAD-IIIA family hydrolase [Bacteroidales bacterium]
MKAVILAGGKGTRMGSLTKETPKPMLEVGKEPILLHQVRLLRKFGIRDIIILVNHLKEPIIEYFKEENKFGVHLDFFVESSPLGTVGGIKEIDYHLQEDFLVLYGDVMINMDLERLISFHQKKNSECTLVLHPNDHPQDSDLVELDNDGRITAFYPKPHAEGHYYPNMVNAGAYILSPGILSFLERGVKADFGRDIFPSICQKVRMYGYNTSEYLKDMGTPERWQEVEDDYQTGKIERSSFEYKQKAIFLDRDGVLNEDKGLITRHEDLILYPFAAEAVKKINQSEFKAIVVTNQPVIARNLCTFEELRTIHNKLDTELGKSRAKLDGLYFCPHHPDRGYPEERKEYKVECLCRKPQPGMLLDAAFDFNIRLDQSFMIGDHERDIQAGINAGCITVGVRTGSGLKNTAFIPDFMFSNVGEAVNFLVSEPYKEVYKTLQARNQKSPSLILIGGKARSGKSTLTSYLKWKLEESKKKVLKIELDNWIVPEDQREGCKNVYDRFQLDTIETDIQRILAGIPKKLNRYLVHPGNRQIELVYEYTGQDVILIEGVVGLSSEVLRELATFKIFTDIETVLHRNRITEYYSWKGKTEEEISRLYSERLEDEYNLIEKERNLADLIIKLPQE